nr:hypothetical protein [Tanacetum cinerariifolium]
NHDGSFVFCFEDAYEVILQERKILLNLVLRGEKRSFHGYEKAVLKNVMSKSESHQFQVVTVSPKGNGVDYLSYDLKLSTFT